jgi:glucose-1-phosphate adenylyltransferase
MSDMRDAIVVLLAGGQGERLWPLTRDRAKPAVPFGALYRIIDITLSNCINSNLRRVFILTQYKALSLNRHIRAGWSPLAGLGDYIEVLPPQMRVSQQWYQGTADAVYQNIYSIGSERSKFVFILSGDHIYKMNYAKMLERHVDCGADVTVGTIQIPVQQAARQFGVIEVDKDWRIVGFEEKPAEPKQSPHHPGHCNASMGIYIFNTQLMIPILLADSEDPKSHHDFGKDILPRIISKHRVFAYNFVDENSKDALYWRDVGTIDAYYEANMDLRSITPALNLYNREWPVRTTGYPDPPAKFTFDQEHRRGQAIDSIVSGACILSGGMVRNSVLGRAVKVHSGAMVDECVILDNCDIGRRARLHRVILDKNVRIPEDAVIGYDHEVDRKNGHHVTESGIVVVEGARTPVSVSEMVV